MPSTSSHNFHFHPTFLQGERASQHTIYDEAVRPLAADVINGRSAAVLAYGQTGAGKTYTVFGDEAKDSTSLGVSPLSPTAGLVPRVLAELVEATSARRMLGIESQLRISCVEVFGDACFDLLDGGASIGAW